jgi:hypothetical protein
LAVKKAPQGCMQRLLTTLLCFAGCSFFVQKIYSLLQQISETGTKAKW